MEPKMEELFQQKVHGQEKEVGATFVPSAWLPALG